MAVFLFSPYYELVGFRATPVGHKCSSALQWLCLADPAGMSRLKDASQSLNPLGQSGGAQWVPQTQAEGNSRGTLQGGGSATGHQRQHS